MSTSNKTPASDHSHGGPGNSQQDATKPAPAHRSGPLPWGSPPIRATASLRRRL